jgi:hypothetical protein
MRPRRGRGYPRDRDGGPWGGVLRGGTGGSASYCVLRKSVTRDPDREGGRDGSASQGEAGRVGGMEHIPRWSCFSLKRRNRLVTEQQSLAGDSVAIANNVLS